MSLDDDYAENVYKRLHMTDFVRQLIIDFNPQINGMRAFVRGDGRVEWICIHGVGHPVYDPNAGGNDYAGRHGCDGCCKYWGIYTIREL